MDFENRKKANDHELRGPRVASFDPDVYEEEKRSPTQKIRKLKEPCEVNGCSTPFKRQLASDLDFDLKNQTVGEIFASPNEPRAVLLKSGTLPKPDFSSDSAKKRHRFKAPRIIRNQEIEYHMNDSVSFDGDHLRNHNIYKRRSVSSSSREPSFRVKDPTALLNKSGQVIHQWAEKSGIQDDSWSVLDSTNASPISSSNELEDEVCQILGRGDSGVVQLCRSKADGSLFVRKTYVKVAVHGCIDLARVMSEAAALSRLSHPNIVGYLGSVVRDGAFCIHTEYCNGFDLRKIIDWSTLNEVYPSEEKVLVFLRQMLDALAYIHRMGIVHFDFKPDNIMSHVCSQAPHSTTDNDNVNPFDPPGTVFKLGDFGHCFIYDCTNIDVTEGDSRYLARECLDLPPLENYFYDSKTPGQQQPLPIVDIYALGLTTAEYCGCGDLPSYGEEWHKIRSGQLPDLSPKYSQQLVSLLKQMIHPDPKLRPSAVSCLTMTYISR